MMRPKIVLLACLLTIALPVEAEDPLIPPIPENLDDPEDVLEWVERLAASLPICHEVLDGHSRQQASESALRLTSAIFASLGSRQSYQEEVYFDVRVPDGSGLSFRDKSIRVVYSGSIDTEAAC